MECERERPHRTTSNNNINRSSSTSELFVCFTSRLSSSSSMKLSSKSILSPNRSREPPQISLQSSLSRRLRNNGSIKGGGQASPMFPAAATTGVGGGGGGKRRGCGFDNPEPSSPKVTCIGQVRVKTKKQGKKMRSRSKRRGSGAGAGGGGGGGGGGGAEQNPDLVRQNSQSFQYLQQQECLKHRNQRWVHIPLTICEALREFSCFFPCKSSCISKEDNNKGERSNDENGKEASCGAAFARWLMALQEGDGKGREIELVMREEEEEEEEGGDSNNNGERSCYSHRRHVLEDIDIGVVEEENKKRYKEFGEVEEEEVEEEEKGGRVSICVPPKNALLLMRCRSDPVKMAALANRFWESPVHKDQVVEDEDENGDNEGEVVEEEEAKGEEGGGEKEPIEIEENDDEEEERKSICESEIEGGLVNIIEENLVMQLEETEKEEEEEEAEVKESCEIESKVTNFESNDVLHEPNQDKEVEVNEEGEENNESEGEVEEGSVIIHEGENFSCDSNSTLEVHLHADLEKEEIEEVQVELEPSLKNMEEEQENEGSSKLYPTPSIFIASELQSNESKAESESEANKVSESAAANEGAESEAIVEANEDAIAEAEGNEEAISVEAELEGNGEAIAETEANEEAIAEAEAESEVTATMAGPEAEEQEEKVTVTAEILSPEQEEVDPTHEEPEPGQENGSRKEEKEGLPECLLLMMCEPKLSMEVSKETWVCSTDFVRWLPPDRFAGKTDGAINERRFSLGSKPKRPSPQRFLQPPRSSCSIPAATAAAGLGGLAGMIEQKLMGSKGSNGYEPFVLTRCKSEPVRSSAKLVPLEACFWKDRKLEPVTLGVGAPAGVGF